MCCLGPHKNRVSREFCRRRSPSRASVPARGQNCCFLVDRQLPSGIISACGWAGPTEGGSGYSTGFGSCVFFVESLHTKAAFLLSVYHYGGF